MTQRNTALIRACLLSICLLSAAAQAAEMTLYRHPGFAGSQLTLRGHTPNIANQGFQDRASSIVVTSGRWEVCTQPEFKGDCVTLNPGEYPTLDARVNHRIESAREVGSFSERTGPYNRYGRGAIELVGQPGFMGRSMELDRDAPTFEGSGFNDRASSLVVKEGTWQLCSDAGFAGTCRIYAPGRYSDLGPGMTKQISSARVVRAQREAPAVLRGGYDAPPAPPVEGNARVTLFSGDNFRGDSMAVSDTAGALERAGFDNAAASMVVEGGQWLFCTDSFFRGNCRVVGPGRYGNLRSVGLYQNISSIRPAAAPAPPPRPAPTADIELFTSSDFGGRAFGSKRDVTNFGPTEFNDKFGSIVINSGQWELCTDEQYGGRCAVFGPGRYPNIGGFTNQISSMRRIR